MHNTQNMIPAAARKGESAQVAARQAPPRRLVCMAESLSLACPLGGMQFGIRSRKGVRVEAEGEF